MSGDAVARTRAASHRAKQHRQLADRQCAARRLRDRVIFSDFPNPVATNSQGLRDNRQVQPVLRHFAPRCPARKGFSRRNKAPFFFISHSETNCGVIFDITHSDLAIVSRQVL
ncbi:hypothetical protein [Burkholderia sp. A2]|uniref:hypothetical protein n=1 Tax=Burkholderia sp. A2 TaxID=236253 RepID=UPI00114CD022|nr:hypothetical protein [Burkholderia sp. A2]